MSTGRELLELARQHIGERYVFGARVPFDNPNYKGPWDCAEFISWIVYQSTGIKVGVRGKESYTGYWKEDISKFCQKISINDAAKTPGAVVLRSPGYNGIKIGHIAFSDGNGGTVEAKSARDGVCQSTIAGREWEVGLLINNVDYQSVPLNFDYHNPPFNFYVKSPLMKHPIVKEAKQKLSGSNFYHGIIDDVYNVEMAKAVTNFQNSKGLVVDGIMGKETLTALHVKEYSNLEKALLWFKNSFGEKILDKIENTPFDINLLTAIAYQETGYLWSRMIGKTTLDDLLLCCTGDTLDTPNRSAFPKNKAELIAHTNGERMFEIAREALKNVGKWDSTFNNLYNKNPNKFCRGYGIFQYDLQFFKDNPNYFLNKEWADFDKCLDLAVAELKSAQNRIPGLKGRSSLSSTEKVYVAIAYNKGSADITKGLKQGHKNNDSGKYYGELINEYYLLCNNLH